jgi:hypothetical protein
MNQEDNSVQHLFPEIPHLPKWVVFKNGKRKPLLTASLSELKEFRKTLREKRSCSFKPVGKLIELMTPYTRKYHPLFVIEVVMRRQRSVIHQRLAPSPLPNFDHIT